jgi:hypothetical protein
MRLLLSLSALVALSASAFAQQGVPACPQISVNGPAGTVGVGKDIGYVFVAMGWDDAKPIGIMWTVSQGDIVRGQGTRQMFVRPVLGQNSLNASAVVTGLPEGCPNQASETASWDRPLVPSDILKKDYDAALAALDAAVSIADTQVVTSGLGNPIITIRIKSAEALKDLCDEKCVPALAARLEATRGRIDGGTEMQLFQVELKQALIAALRKITGLDLPASKDPTSREIDRIARLVRDWENRK